MSDWRELGIVSDYRSLMDLLRNRAAERHVAVSGEANEIAGLPQAYLQKLLAHNPARRLGLISLGPVLGVLGVKLIAVEDAEAIKRFGSKIGKRDERCVRSGPRRKAKRRRRQAEQSQG